MALSPYWNPKNETLPREDLRALQLVKLQRMCAWAYEKSPFHRTRWEAAGFHPDQLKTLDDLRRIPFMTREEWMESIGEQAALRRPAHHRPGERHPLPPHLRHQRPHAHPRPRRHEGLGVDRGDVVLWLLGLRRASERHGLLRLRLRLVHRLLGRALRLREDRRARRARAARRPPRRVSARSWTSASPPSAPRRPTRCGSGSRPRRWASTSPKTARWTRSSSPASRPARFPPSSASSNRRGARSAPTPPG